MKDTVQLARSKKTEERFKKFVKEWKKKHKDLDMLDEMAVDYMRDMDVPIERVQDLSGNQYYLLKSPYPYAGATEHYVLYMGLSDYPPMFTETARDPNNPRYPSFVTVIQNGMVNAATVRSLQNGYKDYLIVVRSEKEWSDTVPHVQLIIYSHAVQEDHDREGPGAVQKPERKDHDAQAGEGVLRKEA